MTALLNYLWGRGCVMGAFTGVAGERIVVLATGEEGDIRGEWHGARIEVDGERRVGTVVVGSTVGGTTAGSVAAGISISDISAASVGVKVPVGTILRVVERDVAPVLGGDDELVPQITFIIDGCLQKFYDELRRGAARQGCAKRVAGLDLVRRTEVLTALLVRRLQRKTQRIGVIYGEAKGDWHQTFHVLLLETMGGNKNKDVFVRLARSVTQTMLSREKGSPDNAEALLVGGAGFLSDAYEKDERTRALAESFAHLAAKYSIVPLRAAEWDLTKLYPANHPQNRLRQIAALVCKRDFMLDGMLGCRTSEDVERLFTLPPVPVGVALSSVPGSIGAAKARLVGINLVAPLMFAYGRQTGLEELCERAVDLLSTIAPERNSKLAGWYDRGCGAESAFDSQALLELNNEFCMAVACADCRVGRAALTAL